MSLTINGGTTITGGFTLNSEPIVTPDISFTISDIGDFTASAYQGPGITDFGGSIGLLSDGSQTSDVAQYGIARTDIATLKLAEILAYFAANSLVTDASLGYNFTVAGTGGASNITKAIIGLDGVNFIIAPVGAAGLTNFATNTSPMNTIINANGILAFPVTFTLDSPLITHPGSWW
jgi:hypothetical protein